MGIVFIVTYAVVQIGLIVGLIAAGGDNRTHLRSSATTITDGRVSRPAGWNWPCCRSAAHIRLYPSPTNLSLPRAGWLIAWHALIKKQKIVQELLGIEPTMVAGSAAMPSREQHQPSHSTAVAQKHGSSHLYRQERQTGSSGSGGQEQLQQSAGELDDEGEKKGGDDADDGDNGDDGAIKHAAAWVEEHED